MDWVRQSNDATPALANKCTGATAPCLVLIAVASHPVFFMRRTLVRHNMQGRPPGMEFVFVLAMPKAKEQLYQDTNYEALLKWEFETFGDLVFLDMEEVDSHMTGVKSYNMFKWAAGLGKGRFMYVAKADDDQVLNPHLLRLHMSMLPRHDRVYWGRHGGGFFVGPLYFISEDFLPSIASKTYSEWLERTDPNSHDFAEDIKMGQIVSQLVPEGFGWFEVSDCELHNILRERTGRRDAWSHETTNMTIVVHDLKDSRQFEEAFSTMLPWMEEMKRDCKEWWQQGEDPKRYGSPPTAEACKRWYRPPGFECKKE